MSTDEYFLVWSMLYLDCSASSANCGLRAVSADALCAGALPPIRARGPSAPLAAACLSLSDGSFALAGMP